jgi:hypothetical protein
VALGELTLLWADVPPAPEIQGRALEDVAVDRAMLAGVADREPVVPSPDLNLSEFQAYNYLVSRAARTPDPLLARHARHDLTFAHLFEEPEKYRGQVVHIEGRLRRLRKFDQSRQLRREGVSVSYEGWIFGEHYFSNPYCVVVTEIPKAIAVGERLEQDVSFNGYFFKRYRYRAGDGLRDAPLLIGRTLTPREPAAVQAGTESPTTLTSQLLMVFLSIVVGTIFLGGILIWWFRRGDARVQRQLDRARRQAFLGTADWNEES